MVMVILLLCRVSSFDETQRSTATQKNDRIMAVCLSVCLVLSMQLDINPEFEPVEKHKYESSYNS
jgi:hypothetical protein